MYASTCEQHRHKKQFHFGGAELVYCSSTRGFGGIPPPLPSPRKIWKFRHSELVSRAILQALHQSPVHCYSCGTKTVAQLGLERSPVRDLTDVPSHRGRSQSGWSGFGWTTCMFGDLRKFIINTFNNCTRTSCAPITAGPL